MKIIEPSFEMYDIPEPTDRDGVLMHLEKIGRTCYKSEDKITLGSANKFLQNIRNHKHWAMLEHYIFTVSVPEWIYRDIQESIEEVSLYEDSEAINKLRFINSTCWGNYSEEKYQYLVSFSITSLNYLYNCNIFDDNHGISTLIRFMRYYYPELIIPARTARERNKAFNHDEIEFVSREEMKTLPKWIREVHDFMSVKFTIDRGITHEVVRHRPASYAQESTRYCNYSQGKFGNEITVILPSFFDTGMGEMSNSLVYNEWKTSCESSERHYFKLLEMGATPQQARSVLPNSLKAELIMTANLYEFRHFFNMRCPTSAHPQMREVAVPLLSELIDNEYYRNVFEDQSYLTTVIGE